MFGLVKAAVLTVLATVKGAVKAGVEKAYKAALAAVSGIGLTVLFFADVIIIAATATLLALATYAVVSTAWTFIREVDVSVRLIPTGDEDDGEQSDEQDATVIEPTVEAAGGDSQQATAD